MTMNRNTPGSPGLSPELEAQLYVWQQAHPQASLAEMELGVAEMLNGMRAQMLERLTVQAASAFPPCPECGGRLESRGQRSRTLIVEGEQPLTIQRRYAQCPACGAGLFPLDEALGLLPQAYSPWVVQAIVRLGTWLPFERVPETLAFFTGVTMSAETARRITEQAGAALVAWEAAEVARIERDLPASPAGPALQQLSADGAMVPLVGGDWAEVRTLAIGAVEQRTGPGGQPVAHTTDLSYVSRLTTAAEFNLGAGS